MLPEVAGKPGQPSATEAYTNYLQQNGIFVQGDNYYWKGTVPNTYAIHSAREGMCPLDFSKISVAALAEYARAATGAVTGVPRLIPKILSPTKLI